MGDHELGGALERAIRLRGLLPLQRALAEWLALNVFAGVGPASAG